MTVHPSARGRHLLVLSPAFHDYDLAIAAAFEALGFRVTTCLYDRFPTVSAKVRNKIRYELPERLGRDTTSLRMDEAGGKAIRAIRETSPDLVLVVKGDVLSDEVWDEIDRRRVPTVLWLYDELRRTRWAADPFRLRRARAVASYSVEDCNALSRSGTPVEHVPLGFDNLTGFQRAPQSRDISFIGARYPNRQLALENLSRAGVPVTAYGRDWSTDWRDRMRTWSLSRPDVDSRRDVTRTVGYGIMQAAAGTLNIHGDQDGFTIRTFEAAGVGAIQICDRADVSIHYEVGVEMLVHDSLDHLIELCRSVVLDRTRGASMRRAAQRRTLAEHTLVHRAGRLVDLF